MFNIIAVWEKWVSNYEKQKFLNEKKMMSFIATLLIIVPERKDKRHFNEIFLVNWWKMKVCDTVKKNLQSDSKAARRDQNCLFKFKSPAVTIASLSRDFNRDESGAVVREIRILHFWYCWAE